MEIEFLNDTTFGYLLIGIALVVVLGLVFVIASRGASGRRTSARIRRAACTCRGRASSRS